MLFICINILHTHIHLSVCVCKAGGGGIFHSLAIFQNKPLKFILLVVFYAIKFNVQTHSFSLLHKRTQSNKYMSYNICNHCNFYNLPPYPLYQSAYSHTNSISTYIYACFTFLTDILTIFFWLVCCFFLLPLSNYVQNIVCMHMCMCVVKVGKSPTYIQHI